LRGSRDVVRGELFEKSSPLTTPLLFQKPSTRKIRRGIYRR